MRLFMLYIVYFLFCFLYVVCVSMLIVTKLTILKIVVENRSRLIYNKDVKKSKQKSVRRLSRRFGTTMANKITLTQK